MRAIVTRRSCLLSLLAAGALMQGLQAQDPAPMTASGSSAMPIACRTVHLTPVVRQIERTVITALAADPRGRFVAVAGDDHAIRILDSTSLDLIQTLKGHRDLIRTLAFDREGKRLASAGNDGQLIIWDRDQDFRVLQRMAGTPALACVRFSPDGKEMAAVGFERNVYVIGRESRRGPTLKCDCNDLRAVAYRGDNKMLAVAGRSGDLHLFNTDDGKLLSDQKIHKGRIHAIEFQPDANLLISVAEDGSVVVFDTKTMKLVRRIPVSTGKLFAVSVLDSRHVAVAGSDNLIRVIDIDQGNITRKLSGHSGSIRTLSAYGNVLYSGGFDTTLRRWSLTGTGNQERIAEGNATIDRQ